MQSLNGFFMVFVGAGIGGALRHAINLGSHRLLGPDLPIGTLATNVLGSFLIGVFVGHAATGPADHSIRLFVVTGLLGGFTTFSAYSLDTVTLWQRGQAGSAVAYAALSVMLSLGAAAGGLLLSRTS
jgi:CrcB protein